MGSTNNRELCAVVFSQRESIPDGLGWVCLLLRVQFLLSLTSICVWDAGRRGLVADGGPLCLLSRVIDGMQAATEAPRLFLIVITSWVTAPCPALCSKTPQDVCLVHTLDWLTLRVRVSQKDFWGFLLLLFVRTLWNLVALFVLSRGCGLGIQINRVKSLRNKCSLSCLLKKWKQFGEHLSREISRVFAGRTKQNSWSLSWPHAPRGPSETLQRTRQ